MKNKKPKKKKIILIRHTEAIHNLKDVLGGWKDTELTERGKERIKKIIKRIEGKELDVIYTSDLKRCYLLADKLSKKLNCPLIVSSELRERSYGSAEGKRVSKIPKDAESFEDFEKRIIDFIKNIKFKRVVLITHGGPIRSIIKKFKGEEIVTKTGEIINIFI